MEPWQERVVLEKAELDERYQKLDEFRLSDAFRCLSQEDRDLLNAQLYAMCTYSNILHTRIAAFHTTGQVTNVA